MEIALMEIFKGLKALKVNGVQPYVLNETFIVNSSSNIVNHFIQFFKILLESDRS